MIEIYIAGHGEYAKGIVSALDILLGDCHGITPVCAYCGDITSISQLANHLARIADQVTTRGNDMVLFTDIPGGSVNNSALKIAASNPHVHLISGASVVMLLEFYLNDDAPLTQRISTAIQVARGASRYQNQQPDFIALRDTIARCANTDSAASC